MKIEIRADNSVHIEGYVNAVERDSNEIIVPTVGRCVEQIRAGAFGQALSSGANVDILENHDAARKLGSISQGNLSLHEDSIGLHASTDITDEDIVGKARRGELKGWSFGFVCTDSEIEQRAGNVPRRIVKALSLSEVSLIDGAYKPCYNGTLVEVRSEGDIIEYRGGIEEIEIADSTENENDVEERAEEVDYSYYDALLRYHELRYNPYHDPGNGRFCSGGGGGGGGVLIVPKGEKGKGFYTVAAKDSWIDEKGQYHMIFDGKGKQDLEFDREAAIGDMYDAMMAEREILVNKSKYTADIDNAPIGNLEGIAEGYQKKAESKENPNNIYIVGSNGLVTDSDRIVWNARRKASDKYNSAYQQFKSATDTLNGAYNTGYKNVKNTDPNKKYRNGERRSDTNDDSADPV